MNEVLQNIEVMEVLKVIWNVVLIPILSYVGKQTYDLLKSKKLDKYGKILYTEISNAVKCIYQTEVKNIKTTSDWTKEKQQELKELAKNKAIQALSSSAYKCLKAGNDDFEEWLDTLVESALYDVKYVK